MKIQEQDIYHGPALMQIVEHDSFKALNKADVKYGHYLVNNDKRLCFKYSTAGSGPWSFTFQPTDLKMLEADLQLPGKVFVVLVCGHHSICCLDEDQVRQLISIEASGAQWIKVDAPSGRQMRATGSVNNKTPILVPHKSFPNCIF